MCVSNISEAKYVVILKTRLIFPPLDMTVSSGLPSSQEGNNWFTVILIRLQCGQFTEKHVFPRHETTWRTNLHFKCPCLANRTDQFLGVF